MGGEGGGRKEEGPWHCCGGGIGGAEIEVGGGIESYGWCHLGWIDVGALEVPEGDLKVLNGEDGIHNVRHLIG